MQALPYDRTRLSKTLESPLKDIVNDTIGDKQSLPSSPVEDQSRLVINLGVQLAELKTMVGQIVSTWEVRGYRQPHRSKSFRRIEGSWINEDSDSNVYVRVINELIVAPYCYSGNNELTAYYYDWRDVGEYLFARFRWVELEISGFTFLKRIAEDTLQGAWWYDEEVQSLPDRPPEGSGNQVTWHRTKRPVPRWAREFFDNVAEGRVPEYSFEP
jgi:hypothetical protein